MTVPGIHHPALRSLVLQPAPKDLKCLALRILLSRLQINVKANPAPANITAQLEILHEFLLKNQQIVESDLCQIMGGHA